jgi:hypothetical protein
MGWRHLLPVTVEIGDVPATATPVHGADPGAHHGTHQDTSAPHGTAGTDHRAPRHRARPSGEGTRTPALVEALARLEIATGLRDADAAARILAGLAESEEGQWLLRQCVAAGLREVADHIADGTTPGDSLGQPVPGVAVVTDATNLRSVGPAA